MGFFRQFEIYARTRLEITVTFLNNHRMNFQEIREKSWSGGNGSALRAVIYTLVLNFQENNLHISFQMNLREVSGEVSKQRLLLN